MISEEHLEQTSITDDHCNVRVFSAMLSSSVSNTILITWERNSWTFKCKPRNKISILNRQEPQSHTTLAGKYVLAKHYREKWGQAPYTLFRTHAFCNWRKSKDVYRMCTGMIQLWRKKSKLRYRWRCIKFGLSWAIGNVTIVISDFHASVVRMGNGNNFEPSIITVERRYHYSNHGK